MPVRSPDPSANASANGRPHTKTNTEAYINPDAETDPTPNDFPHTYPNGRANTSSSYTTTNSKANVVRPRSRGQRRLYHFSASHAKPRRAMKAAVQTALM